MSTIKSFEDIEAWKLARELSQEIFELTLMGSFAADYGLRDQINRSTGSIMDNIAEGFERGGSREFIHYLSLARGSAGEVRSQLCRAFDRKYLENDKYLEVMENLTKVSKMITWLISYSRDSNLKGYKFQV